MLTRHSSLVVAIAAVVALTLSSCGGGGTTASETGPATPPSDDDMPAVPPSDDDMPAAPPSDDDMPAAPPSDDDMPPLPSRDDALANPTIATNAVDAISRAAQARPSPGSVTQSSNVVSNNITVDHVEAAARYGEADGARFHRFAIRNGETWSIVMGDGDPQYLVGGAAGPEGWPWSGVELHQRISDGALYVDAYSDIEAPTTVTMGPVGEGDTVTFTDSTTPVGPGTSAPGTLNGIPGTFTCDETDGCSVSGARTPYLGRG